MHDSFSQHRYLGCLVLLEFDSNRLVDVVPLACYTVVLPVDEGEFVGEPLLNLGTARLQVLQVVLPLLREVAL